MGDDKRLDRLNSQIAEAREIHKWWSKKPDIVDRVVKRNLEFKEASWLKAMNAEEAEKIRSRAKALSEFSSLIEKAIKAGELAQKQVQKILEGEETHSTEN